MGIRDSLTRHLRALAARNRILPMADSEGLAETSYKVMSHEELQQYAEDNWSRVPAEKRELCVRHLRSLIWEDRTTLQEWFKKDEFPMFFHFDGGMAVRNALRDVMRDEELPRIDYGNGFYEQNWDDFYMAALRQAVAPKDGEA